MLGWTILIYYMIQYMLIKSPPLPVTWKIYKLEVFKVPWWIKSLTLPAVIADAELLTSQITIAMIWAATVILAVWNIAGFSFPVIVTLTVNPTRGQICRTTPSMAWAIVGTRVDPEGDTVVEDIRKVQGGQGHSTGDQTLWDIFPFIVDEPDEILIWCFRRTQTETQKD